MHGENRFHILVFQLNQPNLGVTKINALSLTSPRRKTNTKGGLGATVRLFHCDTGSRVETLELHLFKTEVRLHISNPCDTLQSKSYALGCPFRIVLSQQYLPFFLNSLLSSMRISL